VKLSCCGSVSDVLCKAALKDDVEGWWGGVMMVVMVVMWPSSWKRAAQRGDLGQKSETEW
jgi:hypothetical protein